MSIDDSNRKALIEYRLKQSDETANDAEILYKAGSYRSTVNRIYYSMFYSLLALGLKQNFETSKHGQLLGWFNKNFVHTGILDKRFGSMIYDIFTNRVESDYDADTGLNNEDILEMLSSMTAFNDEIKKLL